MKACLDSLHNQRAFGHAYDITVVDNNTPGLRTELYTSAYPQLRWTTNMGRLNPYTSRNMGIEMAEGAFLVFLDAKCRPRTDWLASAHSELSNRTADILAGEYNVLPASNKLEDHLYGLLYLQNGKNARNQSGYTAGHLFVKKNVFDIIGKFPDEESSGGDITWTRKAIAAGLNVGHSDKVIVDYIGQDYKQLKQSVKKYGRGIFHYRSFAKRSYTLEVLRSFLPLKLATFKDAIRYRKLRHLGLHQKLFLWLGLYHIKILLGLSLLQSKLNVWMRGGR